MAAGEGFEPSHTESESAVLPLHNPAVLANKNYYTHFAEIVNTFLHFFWIFLNGFRFAFFFGLWYHVPRMKSGRKEGTHEKVDKGAGAVQYAGGTERGAAVFGRHCAVGGICLPDAGFRSAAGGA